MPGKHTPENIKIKELEETIHLRDKEIKDIKRSLVNVLQNIREINEANNYGDPSIKRRKISELCMDTQYELLIDEIENYYKKNKKELSTDYQSK